MLSRVLNSRLPDGFREQLYEGSLTDENKGDMATYFYDLPTTAKRRNKYIYPASSAPGSLKITNLPELLTKTRFRLEAGSYLYPGKVL